VIYTRRGKRFPELHEDIGEDPAEYLDRDLTQPFDGDGANTTPGDLLKARVRGIDSFQTLQAFVAVERRLGYGDDDGGREHVLDLLWERREELEALGERPDRLPDDPPQDIESTGSCVVWTDREGGTRESTYSSSWAFGGPAASLGGEEA
jgi:hypothetical protein